MVSIDLTKRRPRISSSGMPKSQCRRRQAVDECGALLGPQVFIVNTVMGGAVVAGDPLRAHDAGWGCLIGAGLFI